MHPSTSTRILAATVLLLGLAGCGGGGGGGDLVAPGDQLGVAPTETRYVTNLDDSGPGSLRQELAEAIPGAWVLFDDALPSGTIHLVTPIEIDRAVAIGGLAGDGARMEIDGGSTTGLFNVHPGAHLWLNDLALLNGENAGGGGAIHANEAQVTVWRSQFAGNGGGFNAGGAIRGARSHVRLYDSSFVANSGQETGALYVSLGTCRIERCSFFLNAAWGGSTGAAGFLASETVIVNSSFIGNTATAAWASGGAITANTALPGQTSILRIYSSTVTGNSADSNAGGISLFRHDDTTSELHLYRSIVAENLSPGDQRDIRVDDNVLVTSHQNIIGVGDGLYFWNAVDLNLVGDAFSPADPMLGPVVPDPSGRVMRVPDELGPANGAVLGPVLGPEGSHLFFDQRGQIRDPALGNELGAIERTP